MAEATKRVSARGGDLFKHKRNLKKEEEVSPQAGVILAIIEKEGEITRADLEAKLSKELTTKQPAGRVLSYYKKNLEAAGLIVVSKVKPEPKPKAEKKPKEAKPAKPKAAKAPADKAA